MKNTCEMEVDDVVQSKKRKTVKCRLKGDTEIDGEAVKFLLVLTSGTIAPFEHLKIDDENLPIDVKLQASAQTKLPAPDED